MSMPQPGQLLWHSLVDGLYQVVVNYRSPFLADLYVYDFQYSERSLCHQTVVNVENPPLAPTLGDLREWRQQACRLVDYTFAREDWTGG